jgi:hypothetical protein
MVQVLTWKVDSYSVAHEITLLVYVLIYSMVQDIIWKADSFTQLVKE